MNHVNDNAFQQNFYNKKIRQDTLYSANSLLHRLTAV